MTTRADAMTTAAAFIVVHYPDCRAAFLAGSVMRGDHTPTSDLDIVIVAGRPEAPFRESLYFGGWPVEAFVHTPESIRRYFARDVARRRPSLAMMCTEGAILRNLDGLAAQIRAEAEALLAAGPPPLTPDEIDSQRYFLTDLLDDLQGAADEGERFFIAAELAQQAAEFVLAYHGQWTGIGKWTPRALHRYNPALADRLAAALRELYCHRRADALIAFVDGTLAPAGGRLFAGFRQQGQDIPPAASPG